MIHNLLVNNPLFPMFPSEPASMFPKNFYRLRHNIQASPQKIVSIFSLITDEVSVKAFYRCCTAAPETIPLIFYKTESIIERSTKCVVGFSILTIPSDHQSRAILTISDHYKLKNTLYKKSPREPSQSGQSISQQLWKASQLPGLAWNIIILLQI